MPYKKIKTIPYIINKNSKINIIISLSCQITPHKRIIKDNQLNQTISD